MVSPKEVLETLGYVVDSRGNIRTTTTQLAILSLENTEGGGILRIHGDNENPFYEGDPSLEEFELTFPAKVTSKYIYFRGRGGNLRVERNEFLENTLQAMREFNRIVKRSMCG
jgi:hypothetical protein